MQLQDQVVIVTGGAAGIGGAISKVLAQRGAKIVAVDINVEAGKTLENEYEGIISFLEGDVSEEETAQRAVRTAVERFGKLTGLVNNAHASRQAPFLETTAEMWDLSFSTGFTATRNFMIAAYPHLATSGGSIVNFGSGAAIVGQPTQSAYAAAKEAIRGLSRVVANEWAKDAIRVNIVSPMAMTEGVRAWRDSAPKLYEESLQKVPLGRFGDPISDVAPVIAFLLSDDSVYLTGQTLMADGGANKMY